MKAFWRTMCWDWRQLARQRVAWSTLSLTLALSLLAGWNGVQVAQQWREQVGGAARDAAAAQDNLLDAIASGDSWSAMAFSAEGAIVLPPAPLVEIASGRSDLDPRTAKASTFTKRHELFRHYEIDSPLALALGRFDLAFLVQVILPLLVIALGYGVLADERERGLDRVLATQGVPTGRLLAARLLLRSMLLLAPLLLVLGGMQLLVDGSPQRGQRLAWAVALVIGYLSFWWALVAWVGTWRLREGQTLLVLLAAWVILVLAVPAMVGLASRELHPPPSRFELIAAARAQEIAGIKDGEALMGDFTHDHPDLDTQAAADLPSWAGSLFLTSRMVDDAVAPVVERFDDALAAQQASVARWQYTSPALMLQRGLLVAAGTDERRRTTFMQQARDYLVVFRERTGRMMLSGQSLDRATLRELPAFEFQEPESRDAWRALRWPLLVLWGMTAALLALAFGRVRRS